MLIYVIRHGETIANEKGLLQGWVDNDLNENGVELAKETAFEMKDITFDAVFSSPLKRAKRTAEIILEYSEDLEIIYDDRIKEMNIGLYDEAPVFPSEDFEKNRLCDLFFYSPMNHPGWPEGETVKQLCERTQSFLFELSKSKYDNVLVSTHGCAMRAMLNCLYDDKNDFWHGHLPYNCAVNIIEVKDGEMKLIADDKIYYNPDKCVDRYKR